MSPLASLTDRRLPAGAGRKAEHLAWLAERLLAQGAAGIPDVLADRDAGLHVALLDDDQVRAGGAVAVLVEVGGRGLRALLLGA